MNHLSIDDWRSKHAQDPDVLACIDCDEFSPNSEDLLARLRSAHREAYEVGQKIVFYITRDYYTAQPAGLMLQSIQRMINHVDISNFFVCIVSTNPSIEQEYAWVRSNISTDPVPCNLVPAQGEWSPIHDHDKQLFLISGAIRQSVDMDSLTDRHRSLLFESKTFCMLPWISMYIRPDSTVSVCCRTSEVAGDCSKKSLSDIWNGQSMRQLRLDMLDNKKIDSCRYCYYAEDVIADRYSNRRASLSEYAHLISLIDHTQPDGSVPEVKPSWLTVKINNLCNLSCRMCYPTNSSSWHQPAVALGLLPPDSKPLMIAGKNQQDMLDQIIQHLDHLQQISFEGGEPLMIEEFWTVLEELDRRRKHDIALHYNTNLTKSRLRDRSIFDLWNKFSKIYVSASLDADGERGEYLRPGAPWSDVLAFRQEMMQRCPNVFFEVKSTLTLLNALHLPDFHRSWTEQGLIDAKSLHVNFLTRPHYLNVRTAPEYLRHRIIEKYTQHLEWLTPLDPYGKSTSSFQSVIEFVSSPLEFDPISFWSEIHKLDRYHGVDLLTVFPELQEIPKS